MSIRVECKINSKLIEVYEGKYIVAMGVAKSFLNRNCSEVSRGNVVSVAFNSPHQLTATDNKTSLLSLVK